MDRISLIQKLIKTKRFKSYLEIGVLNGYAFFNINCKRKAAVDPQFRFGLQEKMCSLRRSPFNLFNRYYKKESDAFFVSDAPVLYKNHGVDIVLVDGMHEFAYALRDVENSLKYLSPEGVIVIHDCNPQSAQAASSFSEWADRGFGGDWNGDTWKVIPYLYNNRPDLDVFTLDIDYGLGIVRRSKSGPRDSVHMDYSEAASLTYDDLASNRISLLRLTSVDELHNIFAFE